MKFAIVVLSYDQPEVTADCLRSILALKPREYAEKNVFVVHNGTGANDVEQLQARFSSFHHVVLSENIGFAAGANAGIRVAFQLSPWVLFLTQDCQLAHFPKAPPFEPCLSATKVYKRSIEILGSVGGAVDLEMGLAYFCRDGKDFWRSFEEPHLHPFVPRTAFWIHQNVFEKTKGFKETLFSQWEDIDLSIRVRKVGELLQLDESTEVIHYRKGICRKDPYYRSYLNTRNRYIVCRRYLGSRGAKIRFELSMVVEALSFLFDSLRKRRWEDIKYFFLGFRDALKTTREKIEKEKVEYPGTEADPPPKKVKKKKKKKKRKEVPVDEDPDRTRAEPPEGATRTGYSQSVPTAPTAPSVTERSRNTDYEVTRMEPLPDTHSRTGSDDEES